MCVPLGLSSQPKVQKHPSGGQILLFCAYQTSELLSVYQICSVGKVWNVVSYRLVVTSWNALSNATIIIIALSGCLITFWFFIVYKAENKHLTMTFKLSLHSAQSWWHWGEASTRLITFFENWFLIVSYSVPRSHLLLSVFILMTSWWWWAGDTLFYVTDCSNIN